MVLLDEVGVGLERGPGFCKIELENVVGLGLVRDNQYSVSVGTVGKNLAGFVKFIHIAVKKLRHEALTDFGIRDQSLIERVMFEAGIQKLLQLWQIFTLYAV